MRTRENGRYEYTDHEFQNVKNAILKMGRVSTSDFLEPLHLAFDLQAKYVKPIFSDAETKSIELNLQKRLIELSSVVPALPSSQ